LIFPLIIIPGEKNPGWQPVIDSGRMEHDFLADERRPTLLAACSGEAGKADMELRIHGGASTAYTAILLCNASQHDFSRSLLCSLANSYWGRKE
jgi:hypothetical protein